MTGVPPAVVHKRDNRALLMADSDYFATELIRRVEQLARIDKGWRKPIWQQAAAVLRRVRGEVRLQADRDRQAAKTR